MQELELCYEFFGRINLSGKITHPLLGQGTPSFNLHCFHSLVCCTYTLFWPREEVGEWRKLIEGEELRVKGRKKVKNLFLAAVLA